MALFDFLFGRRDKDPPKAVHRAKGKSIGGLVIQVAGHEMVLMSQLWQQQLDDVAQVRFVAECSAIVLSRLDRLALGKFDLDGRSEYTNGVIDRLCELLCRQQHFGATEEERRQYFESFFIDRLNHYGACNEIGELILTGAPRLVQTFFQSPSDNRKALLAQKTVESLTETLAALHAVPDVQELS